MKTTKYITFGLILLLAGFFACTKEENLENSNQSKFEYDLKSQIPYSSISKRDKGYKGTNGSTEILVFPNMNSIRLTKRDLDRQVKELDSAFVSAFSNLDDDARNDKEVELNFSATKPLIDFNSFFLYYSLYQDIAHQELVWMENENLVHNTDPDNHFVFEYSLRAILNTDCEVQVGDSIYKITADGYFALPATNLKSLAAIDIDPNNFKELFDIVFIGNDCNWCKATGCESNKRNDGAKTTGNNRIKWVVSHWTHPWDRRVASKVDNYHKHGSQGWHKYSTYCAAKVYGYISNAAGECDGQFNFNPNNVYATATAKHLEHKIDVQTKTKSGWVNGYTYGAGGISNTKTLTW
jgi:hypothetical protein